MREHHIIIVAGASPHIKCSCAARASVTAMALTSDYTGIFQDEWLRKQKRSELRDFLRSDIAYAIVEGPPGSLKTACVQHVAAELKYSVKECDWEGVYDDERMRLRLG